MMPCTSPNPRKARGHGFNLPLHSSQIVAIAVFAGLVAGCCALQLPLIEDATARSAVIGIYSCIVAALVGLYFKTR